jgi:hypothetical protein
MKRQLELFSKVGLVKKKAVKAKVGDPVYNAYKKAPLAVKKIIDTLEPEDSYNNLGRAAKKLRKLGWDIEYYLDGSITRLYKMKKPAKKVGAKAKAKKAPARSMHKDTKSHNVNIRVMSGVNRKSGFICGLIIKTYTLAELKKINPIYFEKGNDKFFGVYKRKLIISKKLNSQVMIEASKNIFGGETIRKYSVRLINPNGEIDSPKTFDTIYSAADYIGKNIIL